MPLGEHDDTITTPAESRHRYHILKYLLIAICAILTVILVFQTVLEIQIQQANKNNDATQDAAKSAQAAAERTDTVLTAIIAQLNSPENQKQTQITRQRLLNLEYALCGGPCPEAKEKAPQTPTATPSPPKNNGGK